MGTPEDALREPKMPMTKRGHLRVHWASSAVVGLGADGQVMPLSTSSPTLSQSARMLTWWLLPCRRRQQEGGDPPRKPLPRKKVPADLRSLARSHTEMGVKVLAGIA